LVKTLYGEICPVTIEELMTMVMGQVDRVGWEKLILWKMDLKGAFNLLCFRAADCELLAELMNDAEFKELALMRGMDDAEVKKLLK
jgi:hypothetical protein